MKLINYLRYSGCSVILTINPLHWSLIPQYGRQFTDEWAGPNERTYFASCLFLTVRLWIDDGSW